MSALKFRLLRTPLALGFGLGLALIAPFVGTSLVESLMVRLDEQAFVHDDRSVFESGETRRSRPPVRFLFTERGEPREAQLSVAEATAFAAAIEAGLARERGALHERIDRTVEELIRPVEQATKARVETYADWYFGWLTSYRLAATAALSAVDHVFEARVTSLAETVDYDLRAHLRRQYEEQVLDPEITEPELRRAFVEALAASRSAYAAAIDGVVAAAERDLQGHAVVPVPAARTAAPVVTVDWTSQVHKLKVTSHERGGIDAGLRGALVGTSALVGGRAALAFGAGRLGAGGLPAVTGGAVARPLAGRGLGRVALSTAGAAVAGPVGFALGLGTGLVVDLAINETDEALHRDAFEASIRRSVSATFDDLRDHMRAELRRTAGLWFDDAHAALQLRLR